MGKTEMLNIRISATLKRLLEKQAQQANKSISEYVRDALVFVLQNVDIYQDVEVVSVTDLIGGLDDDDELVPLLSALKPHERKVLWALLDSMLNELPISQTAISRRSGVDAKYIRDLRHRPRFGKALSAFVFRLLRGHVVEAINHLFCQSAEGKTMASIVFLELIGMYPVTRTKSVNVGVNSKDMRGLSADEVKVEVVKDWKKQGWTREDFEAAWQATDNEPANQS